MDERFKVDGMEERDARAIVDKLAALDAVYRELGQPVLDALARYEASRMETIWNRIGETEGRTVGDLLRVLWDGMGGESGFRFTSAVEPDDGVRMSCSYCPFAELARRFGYAEVGFAAYCAGDYGIVRGFNPVMGFERTKTLMEGHAECDHRYSLPSR